MKPFDRSRRIRTAALLGLLLSLPLPLGAVACAQVGQSTTTQDGRAQVDAKLAAGRQRLEAGDGAGAEALFAEAAALDGESLRTRTWVLRSWIAQDRINDTLDQIDALAAAGQDGDELDYLRGMAFVRRAEQLIASGTIGVALKLNVRDGYELLRDVLPRHERRFRDGWLSLARAAWREAPERQGAEAAEALRTARTAADRAADFYPADPDVHLARGRIAFSQFVAGLPPEVVSGDQAPPPDQWGEAASHWDLAVKSFAAVLQLARPTPEDEQRRVMCAIAGMQLGNAYMWKQDRGRAAAAYARGLAWAPWAMDFGTIYDQLAQPDAEQPLTHFLQAVDRGQTAFEQNLGTDTTADATILWWRGWARLETGGLEAEAAADFERVLEKWPAYADAWTYLARARYRLGQYDGAAQALAAGWEADPQVTLQRLDEGDGALHRAQLEYLKGTAYGAGDLEAAIALATLSAEADPREAVRWNDLGLFLRYRADALRDATGDTDAIETWRDLAERSFSAYGRALDLQPQDPQLLNDAAVLLQYYLERDLGRARTMYTDAVQLAEAALTRPESEGAALSAERRASLEAARDNARKNLAALDA